MVLSANDKADPPGRLQTTRNLMTTVTDLRQQAETAVAARDYATAAALYAQAADADPTDLAAHKGLIECGPRAGLSFDPVTFAMSVDEEKVADMLTRLRTRYLVMGEQEPANPIPLWATAKLTESYADKETLLQRATSLDPDFAPAYQDLMSIEYLRCNATGVDRAMAQLVRLAPEDDQLRLQAAYVMQDPANCVAAYLRLAEKRAGTEVAASALHGAAGRTTDPETKLELLERLLSEHAPSSSRAAMQGASELVQLLIELDPHRAVERCERLAEENPDQADQWKATADRQRRMLHAEAALDAGDAEAAHDLLAELSTERGGDFNRLDSLRIRAVAGTGDVAATRELAVEVLATGPNDGLLRTIEKVLTDLGLAFDEVKQQVWEKLDTDAYDAPPLNLEDFRNGSTCDLTDYRGQVVLVNFWYPGCGPCRNEFPYVQQIVEALKGEPFTVLAVNGMPEQDSFVLPFIDSNGYDFRPLHGGKESNEAWGVKGFPSAFVVDHRGKVVLTLHPYNTATKDAALSQIRMVLERAR